MKRNAFLVCCFSFFVFCFSFKSVGQTWLWGKNGVSSFTYGGQVNQIAPSVNGAIIEAGYYTHTLTFDTYNLIDTGSYGGYNLFICKYSQQGNLLWARQSQGDNHSYGGNGYSIATDANGNAYVTAIYADTIILGSFRLTCTAGGGSYLVKYDTNGNVIWAKNVVISSHRGSGYTNAIASDKKGNTYLTGSFSDTVTFGTYTLIGPNNPSVSCFLVKYDSSGNVIWARQSINMGYGGAVGYSVYVNDFGKEYILGKYNDTTKFSALTLLPSNIAGYFLVQYDSTGNVLWAQRLQGQYQNFPLSTDMSGNIFITGSFTNEIVLDSDTLKSPAKNAFFLTKYNSNGNLIWARQSYTLDSNDWLPVICSDKANHMYLSIRGGTYHNNKIVYDKDTISYYDTAKYDYPSIIMQLDTGGNLLCHSVFGGGGEYFQDVTADSSGKRVYLAGTLNTPVIFGSDSLWPVLPQQFPFVARWLPCGDTLTGLSQTKSLTGQISVYPNPNKGIFTLALQNVNEPARVEIYNILGEEIYKAKLNSDKTEINLSWQSQGIYLYRVLTENGNLIGSGKLLIEK